MCNTVFFQKMRFPLQIILFICFIQSIKLSMAVTINDLKCVCDIRNVSTSEVAINTLPSLCTAVSTSQNTEADVLKMASSKTSTPFIMYFNGFSYEEWETYLSYETQFSQYISTHNLDGIVFDKLYRATQFDSARNQAIHTFFMKLKQLNPNVLLGIALPKDADVLPYAFDYSYLDTVVDFYVIQTINYRTCKYRTSMKRTCTVGDMRKSLDAVNQTMSNMGKVLLTVQVYSIGIRQDDPNGPILLSYSDMCHYNGKELSIYRKYCKDSLHTLWKKGTLVYDYKLLGVYIQYIDYDDFAGSCDCENANDEKQKFPATAAILSGVANTLPGPKDCSDFGE